MALAARRFFRGVFVLMSAIATLSGGDKPAAPPAPAHAKAIAVSEAAGIDWREGNIKDAFNEARESSKPLLLYWGAIWCHPCNILKATTFKDPGFIARTRHFIAVHLDGDLEEAQGWGDRFGNRGYPTIILLRPDRSVITRLSGTDNSARLIDALRAAEKSTSAATQLLDKARHTPHDLSADDWAMLNNYDWLIDEQLVKRQDKVKAFTQLVKSAPDPTLQPRFALLAPELAKDPVVGDPAYHALLEALLANLAELRLNLHALNPIAGLVTAASGNSTERARFSNALLRAKARRLRQLVGVNLRSPVCISSHIRLRCTAHRVASAPTATAGDRPSGRRIAPSDRRWSSRTSSSKTVRPADRACARRTRGTPR